MGGLLSMILGVPLGVYILTILPQLPTIEAIRQVPLHVPLRIYNSENELLAEYGNEKRIPTILDKTPPLLIDAILATEDDRFYHHSGVDFFGLVRAMWSNFQSKSRGQGASTITMQVARNFFLTREKSYKRKLKEILLAFKMERALTKDEILELYLNKIFLGHRAYGFAAASQVYYGRGLEKLSIPEISMLAGLPKAPSSNNPFTNPYKAVERRSYVLKRLYEQGKIDVFSYNIARQASITAFRQTDQAQSKAPYAAEMARQWIVDRFGKEAYELGYKVTLTINGKYQAAAEEALRNGLLNYDQRHGFRGVLGHVDPDDYTQKALSDLLQEYPKSGGLLPAVVLGTDRRSMVCLTLDQETIHISWDHLKWAMAYKTPNKRAPKLTAVTDVVTRGDIIYVAHQNGNWQLSQLPEVSGALVNLDPNTGAILSLVGGFDYYLSKFNRAAQALRQPGSNLKPFIYSAALENGFTASSLVSGAPVVVEDRIEGIWRPQNYSKKFFGPVRLRKGISLSLNLVSVRLLRAIGIERTIDHLSKFGFDANKLPRSLTLALGSIDVTPIELAAGFSVFANGGMRITPHIIERVVDREGNVLELAADPNDKQNRFVVASAHAPPRAISEQNAFLINSMMQQTILSGTGRRAQSLHRGDLAGKTGTTNNYQDAWFSGFNRDMMVTVFVGFDQPSHLGRRESGAVAALPIWIDYMRVVLKDFADRPLTPPAGITSEFVNKKTGNLTSQDDAEGYLEYYMAGTEPSRRETPTSNVKATRGSNKKSSDSLF